jgi:hypothetical protein
MRTTRTEPEKKEKDPNYNPKDKENYKRKKISKMINRRFIFYNYRNKRLPKKSTQKNTTWTQSSSEPCPSPPPDPEN